MSQLRKPLTEMESAILELSDNDEIITAQNIRNIAQAEYDRISAIPLLLKVVGKGYVVRKSGEDAQYMLKLSSNGIDYNGQGDFAVCWLKSSESGMGGFVENEQEFQIELSENIIKNTLNMNGDITEIVEWINEQPSNNIWSLALRVPRRAFQRKTGKNDLIFSFDNSHIAALFKMVYG